MTNEKGQTMNFRQPPLLDHYEFNTAAAELLQLAESVIFEECCENKCVHREGGEFDNRKVENPTHCRFFKLAPCAQIDCAAYECEVE